MQRNKASRILIVDDHPVVRLGMQSVLSDHPDLTVCGAAETGEEGLRMARELHPDCVVCDLSLDGLPGLEFVKQLAAAAPGIPVLVFSVRDEVLFAERALAAGARGYLMKQVAPERLVAGVRQVLDGGIVLSPEITQRVLTRLSHGADSASAQLTDSLTDRELEVFERIGRGRSTRKIASELHLSVKTVESHRANIKRKLGMADGLELTRRATLWVNSLPSHRGEG